MRLVCHLLGQCLANGGIIGQPGDYRGLYWGFRRIFSLTGDLVQLGELALDLVLLGADDGDLRSFALILNYELLQA